MRSYGEGIQLRIVGAVLAYSWAAPLIVWLLLYPFRIWTLGFYHDDWVILRPPEAGEISSQAAQFASRPVLVLINLAAGYFIGAHPVVWQAIMVLLALCSAFAIRAFVSRICVASGQSDDEAWTAGNISSAVWLAVPWSLGYTAFPTTFNAMLCLVAFSLCGIVIFSDLPLWKKICFCVPLTLFHGLTFEIFFGTPVLIAALYAGLEWNRSRRIEPKNLILMAVLLSTQVALVAYNRLWIWLGIGQNKSFGADALNLFASNMRSLPATLGSEVLLRGLALALLVAIAAVGFRHVLIERRVVPVAMVLFVAGFCAVMSVMIFALGGYGITGKGLFARTTFGISFWLSVGFAGLAPVVSLGRPASSVVSVVSVAGLLILLCASQFHNLHAWHSTWMFEQSVISRFPIDDYMAKAQADRLLVVEAEAPQQEVAGFNAFWDISGALFTAFPKIRQLYQRPMGNDKQAWAIATMLNEPRLLSEWDGSSLAQRWCAGPAIWTLSAPKELLVWRYPSPVIDVVRTPTTFGCH